MAKGQKLRDNDLYCQALSGVSCELAVWIDNADTCDELLAPTSGKEAGTICLHCPFCILSTEARHVVASHWLFDE
jgi:hypothetical protein